MLVKTKNTFLDIQDSEYKASARARVNSCPPALEAYFSESESLSTAPTTFSPTLGAADAPPLFVTKVIVSNLPAHTKHKDMVQTMTRGGFSESFQKIHLEASTDRATCSANITLKHSKAAMSLFHFLHGEPVDGRHLSVRVTQENVGQVPKLVHSNKSACSKSDNRRGPQSGRKIFVGGLRASTSAKAIRQHFRTYGDIKDCGVVMDFNGVSRRFGYCEFVNSDSVIKLLEVPEHYIDGVKAGVRAYCLRD